MINDRSAYDDRSIDKVNVALDVLSSLGEQVPIEPVLTYPMQIVSRGYGDCTYALLVLQFGTRIPAQLLLDCVLACTLGSLGACDESLVVALEALGPHIVDALLAHLPAVGILEKSLITDSISRVYDYIPQERLLALIKQSEGDRRFAANIMKLAADDQDFIASLFASEISIEWDREHLREVMGDLPLDESVAIGPLTELLRREEYPYLLDEIVQTLIRLGAPVPLEPLLSACGYREQESRRSADIELYDELDPALKAALALKRTHPTAFQSILPAAEAMLRGEAPSGVFASRTHTRLARAIGAIGRSEPEFVALLCDLLDWPYWQVRKEAAGALGKLRAPIPARAIQRLKELRHDPNARYVGLACDDALAAILVLEENDN